MISSLFLTIVELFFDAKQLYSLPEYPPACWWDEWMEPTVPSGEARKEYTSKSVPAGAKLRNAPLLAAGIGVLRICHLLNWLVGFATLKDFDCGLS
jgi:hypothetical protein